MNDEINEQLSALMDGEFSAEEVEVVLQAFKAEELVRRRWTNYHLVRDTMQGHLPDASLSNLAGQVSRALENDPPPRVEQLPMTPIARRLRLHHGWKYAAGLALAASLSAVAVLGIQALTGEAVVPEPQMAGASSVSPNSEVVSILESGPHWAVLEPEVEERLNTYLVNHTEYVDMPGMLRYGRIVSYESSR